MDPWTGEILAMASEPDFNPNVYGKVDPRPAAEPRGRGNLRARLDLQDGHRVGGARRKRADAGHADRLRARLHRHRRATRARHASERHADVHRRDREVQQRRRDPHGLQGRRRTARAVTSAASGSALRLLAGAAGRVARHRLVEAERQRAGVGVDGLPGRRHAAADGDGRQLDRQRRRADAAAPRARGDSRRRPPAGGARGAAPDDQRGHGGRR